MNELINKDEVMNLVYKYYNKEKAFNKPLVRQALQNLEFCIDQLDTYNPDTQDEKGPADYCTTREPDAPVETWRLEILKDMESEVVSASGEIIRSMARELLDYRSTHPKQVTADEIRQWVGPFMSQHWDDGTVPSHLVGFDPFEEAQVEERTAELEMELYNLACKDATQDDKLYELQEQIDQLDSRVASLELGEKGSRLREVIRADVLVQIVGKLFAFGSETKHELLDKLNLSTPKVD